MDVYSIHQMETDMSITRESLQAMIDKGGNYQMHVIGRALVVIFNNQTVDEQKSNVTDNRNGMGFTGADAHSGCITAKSYLKYGRLEDWQVERWVRPTSNGLSRITKYWKQIAEAAETKQKQLAA
jgi:hypothetical protein